jgi:hypothetical protein
MKRGLMFLLIGLLAGCGVENNQNPLVGTWLSNKEKSMSYIEKANTPPEKKEFYENILGKLRHEVRENTITSSWIDGSSPTQTHSYTYVKEGDRVVLNSNGEVRVIIMEGDCMWVQLDIEGSREYFCRE